MTNREQYELICEKAEKYDRLVGMLDKIRAEIEQDAFKDVNGSKYISVNRVNQILDKYKAEVEPQESEGRNEQMDSRI